MRPPWERAWLARTPTRLLRRLLWGRLKRRRVQGTVETAFGARMHCDTRDVIQRYIYHFGVWEPNLTAFLPRRLAAGDVFVDVGANIGYYSLLATRAVGPQGSVVAIEAAPEIGALLRRNVALNDAGNVRIVAEASTDIERELRLVSGGEHNIGATSTVAAEGRVGGAIVHGRPLWDQLTADERGRARLVKIDVEGAELDVLRGLHLERAGFRPDLELVVEVSPERLRARGHEPRALVELMQSLGFHAYTLRNDYRSRAYLSSPAPLPPLRAHGPPQGETDLVFSRVDAPRL